MILTAVLLQTTVFARFVTLFGITPDLILVVVISFGLQEGPTMGVVSGFGGGMLKDLMLSAPKGLTGISYLIVGYLVGIVRPYVQSTSVALPILGIFTGSLVGSAIYVILGALLGQALGAPSRVLEVVFLTAVYNTILVPFVYPVVRKVSEALKSEKVYRW